VKSVIRWLLAFVAGVATAAVSGSVIQTQLNLARLIELQAEISVLVRLETTAFDLLHFAPIYAIIVALAFLVALLTATGLARAFGRGWFGLHGLAGFVAVAAALGVMSLMLPVTAIAAARSVAGIVLLSLGGILGGWVYAIVLRPVHVRQNGQN